MAKRNLRMSPSRWSSRSGLSMAFLLLPALALMLGVAPRVQAQCLSAINPVGGSSNLLVLEKNTLRVISFTAIITGTVISREATLRITMSSAVRGITMRA